MLNNVPKQVNRAVRMTTIRHPNAMTCVLWKKELLRKPDSTPEHFGGMATIGGAGVLESEDEADYKYVELCEARVVFSDRYIAASSNMIDTDNGLNFPADMREAMIEPIAAPGEPGWYLPEKPMVLTCFPGNKVVVTYQIVGVTGNIEIAPYTRKYLLNPMNDFAEWPIDPSGNIHPFDPDDPIWEQIEW